MDKQEIDQFLAGIKMAVMETFIRTMPLLARVVATSKIGRKAGIGGMATTDFSPTVST